MKSTYRRTGVKVAIGGAAHFVERYIGLPAVALSLLAYVIGAVGDPPKKDAIIFVVFVTLAVVILATQAVGRLNGWRLSNAALMSSSFPTEHVFAHFLGPESRFRYTYFGDRFDQYVDTFSSTAQQLRPGMPGEVRLMLIEPPAADHAARKAVVNMLDRLRRFDDIRYRTSASIGAVEVHLFEPLTNDVYGVAFIGVGVASDWAYYEVVGSERPGLYEYTLWSIERSWASGQVRDPRIWRDQLSTQIREGR